MTTFVGAPRKRRSRARNTPTVIGNEMPSRMFCFNPGYAAESRIDHQHRNNQFSDHPPHPVPARHPSPRPVTDSCTPASVRPRRDRRIVFRTDRDPHDSAREDHRSRTCDDRGRPAVVDLPARPVRQRRRFHGPGRSRHRNRLRASHQPRHRRRRTASSHRLRTGQHPHPAGHRNRHRRPTTPRRYNHRNSQRNNPTTTARVGPRNRSSHTRHRLRHAQRCRPGCPIAVR